MSILDLFCSVDALDAFWRVFEPLWERELLAASHPAHGGGNGGRGSIPVRS